jgi:DNA-binding CsgD family transcriptional regulator
MFQNKTATFQTPDRPFSGDFFQCQYFRQPAKIPARRPEMTAGRPAFKPTATDRQAVTRLVATGMATEEIAEVIGISHPTLRKHFSDELAHGRAKLRREIVDLLFQAAHRGSIGALRHLEVLTRGQGAMRPGKKEQAQQDAVADLEHSSWRDLLEPGPPPVSAREPN